MPVTETVFLKDDSLCEAHSPLPIKRDLNRFLSINGATFNELRIVRHRLGLKLKLPNRGFIVRVDDYNTIGIGPTLGLALRKPLHHAILKALDRQQGSVVTSGLRPRG